MEKTIKEIVGAKTYDCLELLKQDGILKKFYLAGGTGAALILRHRQSEDLDFFSQKPFNEAVLVSQLRKGKFKLEKKSEGTVIGSYYGGRVSFFYYPYKLLKPLKNIDGVKAADVIDIACMKVEAVASRGARKDFVDLYFIMEEKRISLQEILIYFSKKYSGINYNFVHIKKGLVYFAEAEKEPLPLMYKPLNWEKVKERFIKEVRASRF